LLGMHSNSGITFNLKAMRDRYPNNRPVRFRATAGNGHDNHDGDWKIDLWVFIDGQPKWKKIGCRFEDGPQLVCVEVGPDDRFLTITSIKAGVDFTAAWGLFGDPIIELKNAVEYRETADAKQKAGEAKTEP
jgi:hypothetical protein